MRPTSRRRRSSTACRAAELAAFAEGDAQFGTRLRAGGRPGADLQQRVVRLVPQRRRPRASRERAHAIQHGGDPVAELGGPQLQDRAIPGAEAERLPAGVETSLRLPPPVFGMGLIEAIPTATILARADPTDLDGDGISGRAEYRDAGRTSPRARARRRAWRSVASAARRRSRACSSRPSTAYHQDIGITTDFAPDENVNPLAARPTEAADRVADPELPARDVRAVVAYLRMLAPPAPGAMTARRAQGRTVFGHGRLRELPRAESLDRRRCPIARLANRTASLVLRPAAPRHGRRAGGRSARRRRGRPRVAHRRRCGGCASCASSCDGHAFLLHDGRARRSRRRSCLHGGEADPARDAFRRCRPNERAALLDFVESPMRRSRAGSGSRSCCLVAAGTRAARSRAQHVDAGHARPGAGRGAFVRAATTTSPTCRDLRPHRGRRLRGGPRLCSSARTARPSEAGFELKRWNLLASTRVSRASTVWSEVEFEDGGEEVMLELAQIDLRLVARSEPARRHPAVPLGRFNLAHDAPRNELTEAPAGSRPICSASPCSDAGPRSVRGDAGGGAARDLRGLRGQRLPRRRSSTRPTARGCPPASATSRTRTARPRWSGASPCAPWPGVELGVSAHHGAYNTVSGRGRRRRRAPRRPVAARDLRRGGRVPTGRGRGRDGRSRHPARPRRHCARAPVRRLRRGQPPLRRALDRRMAGRLVRRGRSCSKPWTSIATSPVTRRLQLRLGLNFRPLPETVVKVGVRARPRRGTVSTILAGCRAPLRPGELLLIPESHVRRSNTETLTRSRQDYLKALYALGAGGEPVSDLAARRASSASPPPSVDEHAAAGSPRAAGARTRRAPARGSPPRAAAAPRDGAPPPHPRDLPGARAGARLVRGARGCRGARAPHQRPRARRDRPAGRPPARIRTATRFPTPRPHAPPRAAAARLAAAGRAPWCARSATRTGARMARWKQVGLVPGAAVRMREVRRARGRVRARGRRRAAW